MNTLNAVSATNLPQTLIGAIRYFSDPETCFGFLLNLRWKDGVQYPHMPSHRCLFLPTHGVSFEGDTPQP